MAVRCVSAHNRTHDRQSHFSEYFPQKAFPSTHWIYMDHGTLGLDAYYDVHQQFFDLMMRDKGYTDVNYASRVFSGAAHDEAAWAERLDIPLTFVAGRSH
jgi:hypothetical protein